MHNYFSLFHVISLSIFWFTRKIISKKEKKRKKKKRKEKKRKEKKRKEKKRKEKKRKEKKRKEDHQQQQNALLHKQSSLFLSLEVHLQVLELVLIEMYFRDHIVHPFLLFIYCYNNK